MVAAVGVLIFSALGVDYSHLEGIGVQPVRDIQHLVHGMDEGVFVVSNAQKKDLRLLVGQSVPEETHGAGTLGLFLAGDELLSALACGPDGVGRVQGTDAVPAESRRPWQSADARDGSFHIIYRLFWADLIPSVGGNKEKSLRKALLESVDDRVGVALHLTDLPHGGVDDDGVCGLYFHGFYL